MFVPSKNKREKNNIPADAGHFFKKEIDSTGFQNENLTTKIKRNQPEQPCFFFKNIPKDLGIDKIIK